MKIIHMKTGTYCPYCLIELFEVIKTKHQFCPADAFCEYENVKNEEYRPLSKKQMLVLKISRFRKKISSYKSNVNIYEQEIININKILDDL